MKNMRNIIMAFSMLACTQMPIVGMQLELVPDLQKNMPFGHVLLYGAKIGDRYIMVSTQCRPIAPEQASVIKFGTLNNLQELKQTRDAGAYDGGRKRIEIYTTIGKFDLINPTQSNTPSQFTDTKGQVTNIEILVYPNPF